MAGFDKCLLLHNAKFCRSLINKVKQHPILYKRTDQHNIARQTLWQLLAIECKLSNGSAAEAIWNQLKFQYMRYLRRGRKFRHASGMQFLQPFLRFVEFPNDDEWPVCEVEHMSSSDDENVPPAAHKPKEKDVFVVVVKNDCKLLLQRQKPKPHPAARCKKINTSRKTLSSLELIFLGYAKIMKKMPCQLKIQTKRQIADIMHNAEMQMLE